MIGVHKVRRKLADGSTATYFYAWRGGPKITAAEGTPEFFAEWQALVPTRDAPPAHHAGTVQALINAYQQSSDFLGLSHVTRHGYASRLPRIERAWGDLPLRALPDPRVRGDMLDWRDAFAKIAPREADYHLTILALIFSWAKHRGKIACNPIERPGRVWRGSRTDSVWSETEITAFLAKCPPQLRLPFLLALHTGQREGNVLRLPWSAYDGTTIRLQQTKTGRRVAIPVSAALKAALDATKRQAVTICLNSRNLPWTDSGFRATWRKHRPDGLTFHDLRGTAVTRLAVAGCSTPEIAAITGHSLKSVDGILDKHYLHRDQRLSESAMIKMEKHDARTPGVKRPVKRSETTS